MKTFYYSDGNVTQGLIEMFEEIGVKAEAASEVEGGCAKVTMTDEQWEYFSKDAMGDKTQGDMTDEQFEKFKTTHLEYYWCGSITDTAEEHQKLFDDCQNDSHFTDVYVVGDTSAQVAIDELKAYFENIRAVEQNPLVAVFQTHMSYEEAEQFVAGFGFLCGKSLDDVEEYLKS